MIRSGVMLQPKRYELTQAQWERIAPMLPGKVVDPGRTGGDRKRGGQNEALDALTVDSA